MSSNRTNKMISNHKKLKSCTQTAAWILLIEALLQLIVVVTLSTQALEAQLEPPVSSNNVNRHSHSNNAGCRGSWQRVGNKCIKIIFRPTNYELAKSKCSDVTGSQLATIDDHVTERDATQAQPQQQHPHPSNLTAFLTQNVSDPHNKELLTKQFYVNISSSLLEQYKESQELADSENMSELWLSPYDSEFANITGNFSDSRDYTAFVLVYSKRHSRWGIIPVNPTRKFSIICERQPGTIAQPNDQSNKEHKHHKNQQSSHESHHHQQPASSLSETNNPSRDKNAQPEEKATSIILATNSETNRKELTVSPSTTTTLPQPEMSSMLFREFPQDKSIILGTSTELRCSSLESESTLTWTYNGKEIPNSTNRIKILPSGTLKIEHARYNDEGNYTCKVSSGVMSESKTVRLEIVGRPHQPEEITAELLDKLTPSVRIRWTPGFNGYSPIIKYTVEMKTVNSESYEGSETGTSGQPHPSQWEVAGVNISADQTSAVINDLKPARKYIFRIKATNRIGTSEPSLPTKQPIEVPVQPPSMPPTNLIGTPKSSTSISLQWSPPPVEGQNGIIKGYKIRHKLAGYATESQWYTNEVTDGAHQTFVLDDLIVWQNYEIQVAAVNEKDVGPFSSSIYVKTKEGTPDKGPRNVNVEAINSSSLKITWLPPFPQHINGINQGYRVQVWLDIHQTQLAKELVVNHNTANSQHSAVADGLIPFTEYYVSVKCFTNAGDGPPNEETVKVRTKPDLPEAVANLEFADVLDKSLKLIWKPPIRTNGELEHYTLEYFENIAGGSFESRKTTRTYPASINEAQINNLLPQTSYTFRIYPHTSIGPGPPKSSQITTSVPPVLPEAPTSLVYSNIGPTSVTIHFNAGFDGNAAIDRWIVEAITPQQRNIADHSMSSRGWQVIYISNNHTIRGNSVVVRNLKPFTRYKLRLTPVNIVGQSRTPSESTGEFQTAQMEPEKPPKDLIIDDVTSSSVNARWLPLQPNQWLGNPIGYNLSWSETNNPSSVGYHLINDSKVDTFQIKDLEEFTEYSIRISAVNEAGSSPQSDPIVIMTLEDVPSAGPTDLTAHPISYNSISVEWNSVPKRHRNGIIRGYKIQYQALRADAPLQVKTIEDNTTKHVTLTHLKAYTTYHLAVAAFTSVGDGVYSNVLNVKTNEDTPGIPQNLSLPTISQTTARILWDPPSEPNGEILGYRVSYHSIADGANMNIFSQELHQNERTFKASNLKPENHYLFTVTAKTKEGWGQQANIPVYTYDSELRANLPFFRESWFVILCACLSIVITIIITALLFVQTKSYKYKQDAIKQSSSHDRLGDAGFTIDDELVTGASHYNNGFGLLSQSSGHHRRSNGALSQSTANFTLPKSPPRPHPGSVIYTDDGDDDVFEDVVEKNQAARNPALNYDDDESSGDSLTEKPSEISSSPAPESDSPDESNYTNKRYLNHYANVNSSTRNHKSLNRNPSAKHYAPSTSSSHTRITKPKLPQRPAPSVPHVPNGGFEINSSGSENAGNAVPGSSGLKHSSNRQLPPGPDSGDSSSHYASKQDTLTKRDGVGSDTMDGGAVENNNNQQQQNQNINTQHQQQADQLLNGQSIVNLNGGRIIVDNMAGSRAPLPGFTSFV